MANKKSASTRPASRNSINGQFVKKEYAQKHPRTTENERIRIGR